jgi:hypothetical protein
MSGSIGAKDRHEQAFTINLYGVETPGVVDVVSGRGRADAAQLSNPAPGLHLAGGVLGHNLRVDVLSFAASPVRIEARFAGTLTGNDGSELAIRDGAFSYTERWNP